MTILAPASRQEAVHRIVIKALERSCETHFVGTTASAFEEFASWMKKNLHPQHIGVIFDVKTQEIARTTVLPQLQAEDLQCTRICVENPTPDEPLMCSTARGMAIAEQFPPDLDVMLSVGSGTITDLAKIAARTRGVPLIAIATAASMNGFTSGLAATLDDGLKLTRKAPPPRAVWAHPDVLQAAPPTMSAAGLGDLHSKPISSADWRLSHLLNGTPWDNDVVDMLGTVTELSTGVADGIRAKDPNAYAQLFAGLCLTGIAMQAATPGAQASGAEHLISHYFDMLAGNDAFTHRATDHGAQVAVGCMVSLYAWKFAQKAFATARPLGACPTYVYDAAARETWIRGHFRSLSEALISMHSRAPITLDVVHRRRHTLEARGEALLHDASSFLPDAAWLQNELDRVGCPTRFSQLPVDRARAEACLTYAPWVRARFTILHLIMECGWYDDFVAEALDATY